jgi:CRP/FNR family transcriptional regulator, cyclic AMP receptor protein
MSIDIEVALRGVSLFSEFNGRQISRLAKRATCREFPAGTRILRRGDTGMAVYIVVSGRVTVSLRPEGSASERVLGEMGPGELFGEMALVDEGPRSADVTAVEPTQCVLLTRWDVAEEMRRDPAIAPALLRILSARIRTLQERLLQYEAWATTD